MPESRQEIPRKPDKDDEKIDLGGETPSEESANQKRLDELKERVIQNIELAEKRQSDARKSYVRFIQFAFAEVNNLRKLYSKNPEGKDFEAILPTIRNHTDEVNNIFNDTAYQMVTIKDVVTASLAMASAALNTPEDLQQLEADLNQTIDKVNQGTAQIGAAQKALETSVRQSLLSIPKAPRPREMLK